MTDHPTRTQALVRTTEIPNAVNKRKIFHNNKNWSASESADSLPAIHRTVSDLFYVLFWPRASEHECL